MRNEGIDPDSWVEIEEETLLNGIWGMEQRYFVEYTIKQKGSTALVDENSIIIKSRPSELDLPEIKVNLLRAHNVDPELYYCHVSKVIRL